MVDTLCRRKTWLEAGGSRVKKCPYHIYGPLLRNPSIVFQLCAPISAPDESQADKLEPFWTAELHQNTTTSPQVILSCTPPSLCKPEFHSTCRGKNCLSVEDIACAGSSGIAIPKVSTLWSSNQRLGLVWTDSQYI